MRYLHRGPGAKAWETRRRNKRLRDKQIIDALKAARAVIVKNVPLHTWTRNDTYEAVEQINQALWRFGIKIK